MKKFTHFEVLDLLSFLIKGGLPINPYQLSGIKCSTKTQNLFHGSWTEISRRQQCFWDTSTQSFKFDINDFFLTKSLTSTPYVYPELFIEKNLTLNNPINTIELGVRADGRKQYFLPKAIPGDFLLSPVDMNVQEQKTLIKILINNKIITSSATFGINLKLNSIAGLNDYKKFTSANDYDILFHLPLSKDIQEQNNTSIIEIPITKKFYKLPRKEQVEYFQYFEINNHIIEAVIDYAETRHQSLIELSEGKFGELLRSSNKDYLTSMDYILNTEPQVFGDVYLQHRMNEVSFEGQEFFNTILLNESSQFQTLIKEYGGKHHYLIDDDFN